MGSMIPDAEPAPDLWKNRALAYYRRHSERLNVAFFLGGFLFDVATLSTVDNPWGIAQQGAYLGAIGWFLSKELLFEAKLWAPSKRLEKVWAYRVLVVHFMLGSLISLYSLFFLKSASLASSLLFIALLLGVLVANELPRVQSAGLGLKVALYALCLFSFFSMLWPTFLGFVGRAPFALSLASTGIVVAFIARWVHRRIPDRGEKSDTAFRRGAAGVPSEPDPKQARFQDRFDLLLGRLRLLHPPLGGQKLQQKRKRDHEKKAKHVHAVPQSHPHDAVQPTQRLSGPSDSILFLVHALDRQRRRQQDHEKEKPLHFLERVDVQRERDENKQEPQIFEKELEPQMMEIPLPIQHQEVVM
jgi:hypothetical protein